MSLDALRRRAAPLKVEARRWTRAPGDAWHVRRAGLPPGIRRVYHVHVRKAGGTSLNRAFLTLGGEEALTVHRRMFEKPNSTRSGHFVFVAHDRPQLERGRYVYGWSHRPPYELNLRPGTFTVTVLRDPVARILSLYRYLAGERPDIADGPPSAEEHGWVTDGFSAFLDRVPRNQLHDQLRMFSAGYDVGEAADRVRELSGWFMNEEFPAGVAALSARLGLDVPVRWDRRTESLDPPPAGELTRLREMLEPEYELLDRLAADPGHRLTPGAEATRAR